MSDPIADIMRDAFVLTGSDEYPNDVAKQIRQQCINEIRPHLTGWNAYGWKDGKYIDDIQEYFDGIEALEKPE